MRMTDTYTESERMAFARKAADHFAGHKEHWTYSDGDGPVPGELFALRWGLGNDCVVVVRIGDDEPVNYQSIIYDPNDLPF